MSNQCIIGPHIFRDEDDQPCTVTAEHYVPILEMCFLLTWEEEKSHLKKFFFQQDLAMLHTSGNGLALLQP